MNPLEEVPMRSRLILFVSLILLVTIAAITVACGGNTDKQLSSSMATVTTSISDPPTCASPSGPYTHVYVTISDVQIHASSNASPNDSGWVDLTPNLKSAPKQVDLFALGGTGCVLAQLGSPTNIPAGTYQQIRVYLSPNNTSVPSNACGNAGANCVVVNGTTSTLNLSSETQTGIKIAPGQIAGGAFTVAAGENKSLDIDFDACASIVPQGGNFRLKPTLHAGEVSLTSNAITGQLVDAVTKAPLSSVKEIVALEQKDANGVDRVIMQITPDATGAFNICPVPAGTYDVVAVAIVTSGGNATTAYATTITTGVQPGFSLGNVLMYAQPGSGTTTQQGLIGGLVSTANTSNAGTATDVTVSALQPITIGATTTRFTIPLAQQQSSSINLTTAAGAACAAGTDCVQYLLGVPAVLPYIGAYAPTGASYTQVTGTAVPYVVDVQAFVTGGAGTPSCTPSEVQVATDSSNQPLVVTAGVTTMAADAKLTGCQ
jgi:hypothetical protein